MFRPVWLPTLRRWCLLPVFVLGSAFSSPAADSILPNGDLEQVNPTNATRPACWDKPDGLGVQWTSAPGSGHGKAIRIDTAVSEKAMVESWKKAGLSDTWNIPNPAGNAVADTYGLSFYSDAVPVKPDQPYKISFDFMGPSGGAKVWVRGWGMFQGEKRRRWETVVNCRTASKDWTRFEQEFFPTKTRKEVSEMKVMLYAYYPAGEYWFDNVKIEPITLEEYQRMQKTPPPTGLPPKK